MRWIFFTILWLAFNPGSRAQKVDPLCVLDPAQMPASWRPRSPLAAACASVGLTVALLLSSQARLDVAARQPKENVETINSHLPVPASWTSTPQVRG